MSHWIFGVLAAFIFGAVIAYVNYRISQAVIKNRPQMYSSISVVRQVIHIAGLVAVYFLAPLTPWDRTYMLVAAVLGMTLPMFYFTYRLMKKNDAAPAAEKKEEGTE